MHGDREAPKWRRYLRFWGAEPERDVSDEFQFHLETEIEELVARGLSPAEARAKALERFGDVNRSLAECRASDARRLRRTRRANILDVLRQDGRYVVRGLATHWPFTLTAALTLALGVGANAAVFSLVDRVFLRPPAGLDTPSQLRRIYFERGGNLVASRSAATPGSVTPVRTRNLFNLPQTQDVQRMVAARFPIAAYQRDRSMTRVEIGTGGARTPSLGWVTPDFFRVLGVRLAKGRDFADDEVRFGEPAPVVVVSSSFWRRELASDPDAIGRTIRVNDRPATVVGIAPPGFSGIDIDATDLWLPLAGMGGFNPYTGRWFSGESETPRRWWEERGTATWQLIARVPRGESDEQLAVLAQEALRAGAREALRGPSGPNRGRSGDTLLRVLTGSIIAARGPATLSREKSISVILAGVAALVLIVASANVANLLLGRALQRRRETALRLALGIGRARLLGQVLLESLILALLSAAAATLAALWIGEALRALILPGTTWADRAVDARVAVFALGIGILGGVAAALVSAREMLRVDINMALKVDARTGASRRGYTRGLLVAVQAALSLALLVGTGLFARSLSNVRGIDLGLDIDRVITVVAKDSSDAARMSEVAERAKALPGVTAVALTAIAPLEGRLGILLFGPAGDSVRLAGSSDRFATYMAVEPQFLAALGTGIIRGRDLTGQDRHGADPVMVVSEDFASRAWPGRLGLGECFRLGSPSAPCYTVVGVAQNAHGFSVVEEPSAVIYVPLEQSPERSSANRPVTEGLVVRTAGDPDPVLRILRHAVGDTFPVASRPVALMADELAPQYRPWQLGAQLFAGFAVVALLVASLGLYSVLSYSVTVRRHELGVRLALGAQHPALMRLVMWDGLRHVAWGVGGGVLIVLGGAGLLSTQLYEISPRDPLVIAGAAAVLLMSASLAAIVPAWRAVRTDPMVALRNE